MFIHLDLDCFFVSAHRTIDDSLFHIPVAVGGRSNLNIFSSKKEIRKISTNSGAFVSTILTNEGQKTFKEYFVDENGTILWKSVLLGFVFLFVGYAIYKFGEWLWSKE